MNVNTKPIFRNGSANSEWAKEQAKIYGNKRVVVVLEAQPADQDANIPFTISSQKDETGNDVTAFNFDAATNLLTPTEDIDLVKLLNFHHLITYTGSNNSGGNNDANDVLEVIQRIVDTDGGSEVQEEIDKISSAVDLPAGETIQVRKVTGPSPTLDPTQDIGINKLFGIGWTLKEFNNPVITCSNIQITIEINYYKADAVGGN